jgi:hypothetical protein
MGPTVFLPREPRRAPYIEDEARPRIIQVSFKTDAAIAVLKASPRKLIGLEDAGDWEHMPTMSNLLPNVRRYYAEVGVILETLLGENGPELVPPVLVSLSKQSERVQSLVEHEDPFQVAIEVSRKTRENWQQVYESFRISARDF